MNDVITRLLHVLIFIFQLNNLWLNTFPFCHSSVGGSTLQQPLNSQFNNLILSITSSLVSLILSLKVVLVAALYKAFYSVCTPCHLFSYLGIIWELLEVTCSLVIMKIWCVQCKQKWCKYGPLRCTSAAHYHIAVKSYILRPFRDGNMAHSHIIQYVI